MHKWWRRIAFAALFCFACTAGAAEKTQVKLGTMGWEDLSPMTLITKRLLEKEGYKVQVTNFSEWGIAFSALARGDVDLLVSQVNYVTSDYWTKNKERLEKVSVISHGLRQGIVVPDYMPIDSVDQLNSIKGQVGGKIIGIEPGSGLMRETREAIKQYGLDYTLVDGSTAAMVAQLQSTLERKQPMVTVLWTPSWMTQKFKVKFLNDPKHVFAPPQTYYWIAKKGFSTENPRLRELLAGEYIPIEDITRINGEVKDGKTMDQAVDDWAKQNAVLLDKWATISSK
ncbi:substrate-binding region of ABC-type glycine betaine transport system [Caballeronia hypogeia]|uniref:Substrate-binding region of ABC-type glycine betaine transport system n=1 Tax=Caballeronia hypogeia TaxID=1777140 RepID=A0A158CZ38_9BURK|nr:glycine betaine ABC transporter substrate-binding protein [Caballeronia hypogeia]SAK87638.1 substrate-binding region of ABC-type glycine betaine transport system [Caballeronia hypogeia]